MSLPEDRRALTPQELYALLQKGVEPFLLDVREPWEVEIGTILGAHNIPLGFLEDGAKNLDKAQLIVVMCHKGIRSFHGLNQLLNLGFTNVYHLQGGLSAWKHQVDPSLPDY